MDTTIPGGAAERTERARAAVVALGDDATGIKPARRGKLRTAETPTPSARPPLDDSRLRQRISALAAARVGMLVTALWAFGEALSFPILPEVALAIACVAAPRAGVRLTLIAAAASLLGGGVGYELAAHGIVMPEPLTTPRMHGAVVAQTVQEGAAAVRHQPFSGIPFKVYAAQAGRARVGLAAFLRQAAVARGTRIVGFGFGLTAFGAATRRLRRFYAWYLALFGACFTGFLAVVIASWS